MIYWAINGVFNYIQGDFIDMFLFAFYLAFFYLSQYFCSLYFSFLYSF